MAEGEVGRNLTFPIFNSDGTPFNDLVLHKATYDSVVMSLGDKISGDVYYRGTDLAVTMGEYVEYEGVKFVLVSPPVIVREGMVSDNSELKGLAKYSFTFYHPMYMLANFPFSDVAVSNDQKKYLSENKSFSWIGNLTDFVAKINKNLDNTQWYCDISLDVQQSDREKLSEVMAFDNESIADAIKRGYETWEFPYIVDSIKSTDTRYSTQYAQGKRFLIQFGLPTRQIVKNNSTFIFEYGQGVGLKNNSRTPRNNKIITRIAGYGSEDNIPYGYPQIQWYGNQSWDYTVNNNPSAANSYPIYDGIVGGQKVRLIKHPFTRTHLMPTIYATTLFNKISPYLANGNANPNYNPTLELVDYYDADNTYPNPIVANSPSYEIHEFEDIKPELQSRQISSVGTYDGKYKESVTMDDFLDLLDDFITQSQYDKEKEQLEDIKNGIGSHDSDSGSVTPPVSAVDARLYSCKWSYYKDDYYAYVKYESNGQNFEYIVRLSDAMPTPDWDDTMDDEGNYVQSYFTLTLPALGFDLYACAAITQEMSINMRSGACLGCTFPVMVDWDDYKKNFYDDEGNFDPVIGTGHPRDAQKYPNSTSAAITVVVQKDLNTFGTLMPNIYQKPAANDDFVVLGISLPQSYVTNAQTRLEQDMKQYMRDNNVHYYDYPLKFDEYFLANNTDILQQMRPNVVVKFKYNDTTLALYIKQFTVKFGDKPLPEYNITLTDDVEIVLNDIGKVSEEVSNLRILMGEGGGGGGGLNDNRYLRKDKDDTAAGLIRLIKGLQVGEQFVAGLLGEGGIFRKDADGTTYLECDKMYVRMKAYFDTVEVRRFIHSGGNRIASAAGIKCSRVEWLTSGGVVTDNINNVEKFRCYFRANDDGKQITNDFEANDLAYCKETNINVSQGLSQRFYWRKVVGVSSSVNADGEHYIDLSKSDCLSGSDYPLAQDDIIQLGNTTDTTRQGAIVEYVSGEDAPSYQIYQGINTYSLERKNYVSLGYKSDTGRAYMNVYGDFYFGDRPASGQTEGNSFIRYNQETGELDVKANVDFTHPESTYGTGNLDDFIAAITQNIGDIQDQVDGNIESWFYDYMPVAVDATGAPLNKIPLVINNGSPVHPYYDWYTIDGGGTAHEVRTEREKHLGDTFYDNSSGYAFRFTLNSSTNAFEWTIIEDSAVIKALADAAKAQDTADHKRRVFTAQPYPPYDVGDLWSDAIYPANNTEKDASTNKYYKDLLTCKTAKTEGQQFSIADWGLSTNYTDDTGLNNFVSNTYAPFVTNIQGQVDQKAETWYQDTDPSNVWDTNDKKAAHVGDIWYDTSQNGGHKTYIWQDFGSSANPRYAWAEADVPDAVFDKIDGKAVIFVSIPTTYNTNDMWIIESGLSSTYMPTGCQSGDIVISSASRVNDYHKTDWSKKDRYTDDTKYNNFISALLNGMPAGSGEAAVEAALNAIKAALNQGTTVSGGLVLSTLIGLRDSNNVLWSGINGQYDANALGGGIAAWYGGGMIDHEASPSASNYAKSLFRFDGSGYLAGGNIRWTSDGKVYLSNLYTGSNSPISNLFFDAFAIGLDGTTSYINPQFTFNHIDIVRRTGIGDTITDTSVLNYGEMKERFVPLAFFNALFSAFTTEGSTTPIDPKTWTAQTVINNLKIKVGTWTEQYLSAYGLNGSGGGGTLTLSQPLSAINAAGMGAPNTTGQAIVWNGSAWVYSIYTTLRAAGLYSAGTIASYGNFTSTQGDFIASSGHGFKVSDKDNTYVLLAGGGTAQLSSISVAAATASTLGTIKVGDVLTSSPNVISNTGSAARNYAVLLRADGVAFVQVPWENTDTDTKNTTGTGITQASGNCYIVCATSQDSNGVPTYTQSNAYIKGGYLYSGGSKVLTTGTYTLDDVADGTTRKLSDYTKTANLGSMAFADTGDYALAADTVFKVKVGTTEYTPSSGTVSLPAYPTKTSQLTNDSGFISGYTDTKNTAGGDNTTSKIFLVGMTSQTSNNGNARTYSNANCYASGGSLYSGGLKVATEKFVTDSGYITGITSSMVTSALGYTPANATTFDSYLAKSGGTMTGSPFIKMPASAASIGDDYPFGITYGRIQAYGTLTIAADTDGSQTEYVILTAGRGVSSATAANGLAVGYNALTWKNNTIWHAGNDGSGSGLDADTVDGMHASSFVVSSTLNNYLPLSGGKLTGNLGIGRDADGYQLDVVGQLRFKKASADTSQCSIGCFSDTGNPYVRFTDATGASVDAVRIETITSGDTTAYVLRMGGYPRQTRIIGSNVRLYSRTDSSATTYTLALTTLYGGRVFVGSTTSVASTYPNDKLVVDGSIATNSSINCASLSTSQGLTVATQCILQSGMKGYSICYECASDGAPNTSRSGEINRYGSTLHLQYDTASDVTMCQEGFTFRNSGRTGGTRSIIVNSTLQLTCGSGTPYTDKNWVYNSDMRKKDVIRLIDMDAQRIADAPIFDFTWKSDAVKELTLGSSAQYWQTVFPNAVRQTPDGYLGMDYSSIALASAVLTARKVVDHEKRIRLLEVENEALRREIDQLKNAA